MNPLSHRARRALLVALVAAYGALLLVARVVPWHDALAMPVVLVLAVRALEGETPRDRATGLFLVAAALLTCAVLLVWKSGYAGRNHLFAGVFPLSDAGDYYADAMRVAHGARMSGSGSRRPLSVALFGALLRMTSNTRAVLLVITLVWAGAASLVTHEVWRTHGRRAAQVAFVLTVLFARRYAGLVQSEGLGGPAGMVAFAFLWRAAGASRENGALCDERAFVHAYAAGLACLAVALFARPGPFFVLPALVVWGARQCVPRMRVAALGAGALACGWLVAKIVAVATASAGGFSDYPAIVYGLLRGEEHTYIVATHPYLDALTPDARASAMWSIVRGELAAHPLGAVLALFTCVASYLYLPQGLFGFVWQNPDDRALENGPLVKQLVAEQGLLGPVKHWVHELGAVSLVNAVVMGALAVAFVLGLLVAAVRLMRVRRAVDAHASLLRWAFAGIVLSMPLLPPWITEGVQIHATVFAFFVALVATHARPEPAPALSGAEPQEGVAPKYVYGAWVGVVLLTVLPLYCMRVNGLPARASSCDGLDGALHHFDESTRVRVGPRGLQTAADLRTNVDLLQKRNPDFARAVERFAARDVYVIAAYDVCADELHYVVVDADRGTLDPWLNVHVHALDQKPLVQLD